MAVYVSLPVNVTGVTLSNPSCVDGIYPLAFSMSGTGSIWGNTTEGGFASQYYTTDSGWVCLLRESVTGWAPMPYMMTHGDSDPGFVHGGAFRTNYQNHVTGVVYKDYGVDYFDGDFTMLFNGFCAYNGRSASSKGCVAWSLSNKVGPWHSYTNGGYDVGNAITISITSPCVVTKIDPGSDENTKHQLLAGMPVVFHTTGSLPTGITAGQTYYVLATDLTTSTFKFSATPGGPAINTSGSQSGNHSFTNFPDTQESDLFGLVVRQKGYGSTSYYLELYVGGTRVDYIEMQGGSLGTISWSDPAVEYWLTIKRTEGSPSKIRVDIYTDAARTTHSSFVSNLGTTGYMTFDLPSDEDYRYMYLMATYEDFDWYTDFSHGFKTGFYLDEKYISWGGGAQSPISSDGVYHLDDGTGNTIDATIDVSSLPTINETDNITICNTPVVTNSPDPISVTKMTANGEVFIAGSSIRGFCYKLSSSVGDPTTADSKVNEAVATAEEYDLDITSLTRLTEYKVRAYIIIDGDTYYGDTELATTLIPLITTSAPTAITSNSCTGNGSITLIGEDLCTRRGFCYMLSATLLETPTVANSVVYDDSVTGFSTGTYTKALTGLSSDANYRIRAYMVVGGVTYYGNTVTFKTLPVYRIREFKAHLVANEFNPLGSGSIPKGDYWKDPFVKKVK